MSRHRSNGMGWRWILVVSTVVNALFLAALGIMRNNETAPEQYVVAPVEDARRLPAGSDSTVPQTFDWSEVVSEDLHMYQRNLRRLGCPENLVRAVLEEKVWREYLPRLRQMTAAGGEDLFWQDVAPWFYEAGYEPEPPPADPVAAEAADAAWLGYFATQEQFEIRGADAWQDRFSQWGIPNFRSNFLPEAKQARVNAQHLEVYELASDLQEAGLPEDVVGLRLNELKEIHMAERRDFLTPEEFEKYELRASPHSHLFEVVIGFEATPEEGVAIVRWRESLELRSPPSSTEKWESLRSFLGETRFNELRRGMDPGYRDLVEMAAHYSLEENVANEVFAVEHTLQRQVAELRERVDLPRAIRDELLVAARVEAEAVIRTWIGDDAFGAYVRNADWLRELVDGRPLEGEGFEADLH